MCSIMQTFNYLDVDSFCLGVCYVTVIYYVTQTSLSSLTTCHISKFALGCVMLLAKLFPLWPASGEIPEIPSWLELNLGRQECTTVILPLAQFKDSNRRTNILWQTHLNQFCHFFHEYMLCAPLKFISPSYNMMKNHTDSSYGMVKIFTK